MLYETRKEAEVIASGDAVLQVEGGYIIVDWKEAFERIEEEAYDLYQRGYRSYDRDKLMTCFGYDLEHTESLCIELKDIENMENE